MSENQNADTTTLPAGHIIVDHFLREPLEHWLTVAEAAAALRVSERAIQRRAKAGKLRAKLVDIPTGQQWLIAADSLPEAPTPDADSSDNGDDIGGDNGDTLLNLSAIERGEAPTATTMPAEKAPTAATIGATAATGPDPIVMALLAEKDARIADLRAQVDAQRAAAEDASRNAAELRAALREALKLQTRALPSPDQVTPDQALETRTQIAEPASGASPYGAQIEQPQKRSHWQRFKHWLSAPE